MSGHGEKLSRKHEQAIAALLSEKTVEEAAAVAGISPRSLKDWLKIPFFKTAYAEARAAILDRTVARLLRSTGKAVDTLESNLASEKPSDENRAAVAILDHAMKGVELLDLSARVEALEQMAQKAGGKL